MSSVSLDALFIKKFQIVNPKHYEEKFLELNMIAKHIKFDLWKEHDNVKRNDTFMDYYSKLDLCYFSFLINTSNDMCQTWFNRGMFSFCVKE